MSDFFDAFASGVFGNSMLQQQVALQQQLGSLQSYGPISSQHSIGAGLRNGALNGMAAPKDTRHNNERWLDRRVEEIRVTL